MVAAAVAVGVMRTPPVVMVSVPEIVTVTGVAVLKRTLFVVRFVTVPAVVMSVLLPAAQVFAVYDASAEMFPAVTPLPALTAQLFPPPKTAHPPKIDVPVFAVMVLIVPVLAKFTALPALRVIAPRAIVWTPVPVRVLVTLPTPLRTVLAKVVVPLTLFCAMA